MESTKELILEQLQLIEDLEKGYADIKRRLISHTDQLIVLVQDYTNKQYKLLKEA